MYGLGLPAGCRHSAPAPDSSFQVRAEHKLRMLGYSLSGQEIAVTVAQILYPYFMNIWTNYVPALHTHTDSTSQPTTTTAVSLHSVCACWRRCERKFLSSPLAWVLKYPSHVHTVNQKPLEEMENIFHFTIALQITREVVAEQDWWHTAPCWQTGGTCTCHCGIVLKELNGSMKRPLNSYRVSFLLTEQIKSN